MNWLFLRGQWDERTENSIRSNDDAWLQLFVELASESDDTGIIMFWGKNRRIELRHNINIIGIDDFSNIGELNGVDIVFARGGFPEYDHVIKKCVNAKKIYYGAGRRYLPNSDIYDMILCDTVHQSDMVFMHCKGKTELLIKPFAKHFKYIPMEKKYDVCFIANGTQENIKGIKFVYETAPADISILHLGYPGKFKKPDNVHQLRVDRIDMQKYINQCKMGIIPYFDNSYDSCPRVIPEMLACGLPLLVSDNLIYNNKLYKTKWVNKENFWDRARTMFDSFHDYEFNAINAANTFDIKHAAEDIKFKLRGVL